MCEARKPRNKNVTSWNWNVHSLPPAAALRGGLLRCDDGPDEVGDCITRDMLGIKQHHAECTLAGGVTAGAGTAERTAGRYPALCMTSDRVATVAARGFRSAPGTVIYTNV